MVVAEFLPDFSLLEPKSPSISQLQTREKYPAIHIGHWRDTKQRYTLQLPTILMHLPSNVLHMHANTQADRKIINSITTQLSPHI